MNRSKKSPTSNIVDFANIVGRFKTVDEIKDYAFKTFKINVELSEKNQLLQEKVLHLEKLLLSFQPEDENGNPIKIDISDEELICDMEIRKLRERSYRQELSLEDTKKLDLLVKNKQAIQSHNKSKKPIKKNILRDVSESDIITLARTSLPEDN